MKIPEDIKVAARRVLDPFLFSRGPLDGLALDYAVAVAINAERQRCADIAKGFPGLRYAIENP